MRREMEGERERGGKVGREEGKWGERGREGRKNGRESGGRGMGGRERKRKKAERKGRVREKRGQETP